MRPKSGEIIKEERRCEMIRKKFPIKISIAIFLSLALVFSAAAADVLVPIGRTTGIKLYAAGAIVVKISDDISPNPAKEAGINVGDVIKSANGKTIYSNEDLKKSIESSGGGEVELVYERNGAEKKTTVKTTKNAKGELCIGVWIRDSIAGIGTITYYDPETGKYGALGHGICDSEAGTLIPISKGALMNSAVEGVNKGKPGSPGELIGQYDLTRDTADIAKNCDSGIFGTYRDKNCFDGLKCCPVAKKEEIKRGKATILANLDGTQVEEYEIEITAIYLDGETTKNMLIRATDPRLIEKTGGIVRGMSGSPIIQNGKIVGAVTHVLINDPQKGYAVFIENMLNASEG